MSLAALNLEWISEVDLEGPGLDPGILGIPCSSEFTCFLLFGKCHFSCVNSVELLPCRVATPIV